MHMSKETDQLHWINVDVIIFVSLHFFFLFFSLSLCLLSLVFIILVRATSLIRTQKYTIYDKCTHSYSVIAHVQKKIRRKLWIVIVSIFACWTQIGWIGAQWPSSTEIFKQRQWEKQTKGLTNVIKWITTTQKVAKSEVKGAHACTKSGRKE